MGTRDESRSPDFPSTRISLIQLAARPGAPGYRDAWELFFRAYWRPLYSWLRRTRSTRDDALDLLQDFFVRGLEGPMLAQYDPARGRLRYYLMTCLRNLRSEARRQDRVRPDRPRLDFLVVERDDLTSTQVEEEDPDATFDIEWARRVFSEAVKRVETRLKARKDGVTKRVLREWVLEAERPEPERLAQTLGLTVGNLHVRATRVRHALRDEMLAQVEACTGDGANAREEVDEIRRILMESPR